MPWSLAFRSAACGNNSRRRGRATAVSCAGPVFATSCGALAWRHVGGSITRPRLRVRKAIQAEAEAGAGVGVGGEYLFLPGYFLSDQLVRSAHLLRARRVSISHAWQELAA